VALGFLDAVVVASQRAVVVIVVDALVAQH